MDSGALTTIITVLLSAGGATFFANLVRGWGTIKSGARAREREAVDDLARWRDELDERARNAEADRDFWRNVAARYSGQLARAGIEPVPADPVPPTERAPRGERI